MSMHTAAARTLRARGYSAASIAAGAPDPNAPRILKTWKPFTFEPADRVPVGAMPIPSPAQSVAAAASPDSAPFPADETGAGGANAAPETLNAAASPVAPNVTSLNVYNWRFVGADPLRDKTVIDINSFRINSNQMSMLWNHEYDDVIGKVYDFDIRKDDGLYGNVVFDQNGALGAMYERQVREGFIDTVSVGIMCFPEDVEPLEPDNDDYWIFDIWYIGPEKWNNPELLEVSLTPVPRDITARRQQENAMAAQDEMRRAALDMKAAAIADWTAALGFGKTPAAISDWSSALGLEKTPAAVPDWSSALGLSPVSKP